MPDRLARRPLLELALVVIVAALVFLPFLGTRPLDFSEGHRAVPGWTMLESGDYWHIKMFGLTYFRKPPGMPWVIAAGSALFGETPFGARFPSAIAAILMSGLAWWYGRRWWGKSGGGGGLIAGLAQALFPLMWSPGRTAEIEMLNNLGTQMFALGLVDLLLEVSRRGAESADEGEEGPFVFLRGLCASARDCLLPAAGLLIAALAKGPASAPVFGGILIGACIAARSLRPLRAPGLGVCLIIAASAIALLGAKVYIANNVPDAVRENISEQFLWSSRRVLGVVTLIPLAFASALPISLSLLLPLRGSSNDRADREAPLARTLAWSWLASLALFVLCGVSDARYTMPAAILLPMLAPFTLRFLAGRAQASAADGFTRKIFLFLARPAFWLGALLMGAWWFIALTAISPSPDQLAAPEAAQALAHDVNSGDVWADDAIEARPDIVWALQKSRPKLRIQWSKQELRAGILPPRMSFLLLRSDAQSKESSAYAEPIADGRLNPVAKAKVRKYLFTLYQVQDK